MKQKSYKEKLAKPVRRARNRRPMKKFLNTRVEEELKKAFHEALKVGRKTESTDAVSRMIEAYIEAVKRDGRQPEWPLEIRSKVGK